MFPNVKIGDRIELIKMGEDPNPIEPGTKGTVNFIGVGLPHTIQYGVKWDDGRKLLLCVPPDEFRLCKEGSEAQQQPSRP